MVTVHVWSMFLARCIFYTPSTFAPSRLLVNEILKSRLSFHRNLLYPVTIKTSAYCYLIRQLLDTYQFVKNISSMPPKRRATATKAKEQPATVEIADENAGGDVPVEPKRKLSPKKRVDPKPEPKRGRQTKQEVSPDNIVEASTRPRRGRAAKVEEDQQEIDSTEHEVKIKKGRQNAKKEPPVKADTKTTKSKVVKKQANNENDEEPPKEEPKVSRRGKGGKKEVKKEATEQDVPDSTTKRNISKKKGKEIEENVEVEADEDVADEDVADKPEEPKKGRARKQTKKEKPKKGIEEPTANSEKAGKAPVKNKTTTEFADLDFSCTRKNALGQDWNFKISSWNVDGLRAWCKKDGAQYINYEKPDILCLQETKCPEKQLPSDLANLPDYKYKYWQVSAENEGYAGVGLLSKIEPISVTFGVDDEEHDNEGRCITAEYEKFYLVCVYVPNAGRKLVTLSKRLEWNETFKSYLNKLDEKKPVIICGDMNVAHNEIDLANPKTNTKNAGFTKEEREGMDILLSEGFVDSYRHLYPDNTGAYTFWTYMMNSRSKNVGWRLDYFIISERFMENVCDNVIRDEVFGSDHCPITLFITV